MKIATRHLTMFCLLLLLSACGTGSTTCSTYVGGKPRLIAFEYESGGTNPEPVVSGANGYVPFLRINSRHRSDSAVGKMSHRFKFQSLRTD